jgi:adenylosuccinate lyase
VVQRNAMVAWDEGRNFRALLEADPDIDATVAASLDDAFDLQRSLRNLHHVFDALDPLDP